MDLIHAREHCARTYTAQAAHACTTTHTATLTHTRTLRARQTLGVQTERGPGDLEAGPLDAAGLNTRRDKRGLVKQRRRIEVALCAGWLRALITSSFRRMRSRCRFSRIRQRPCNQGNILTSGSRGRREGAGLFARTSSRVGLARYGRDSVIKKILKRPERARRGRPRACGGVGQWEG
jgi:hypothetical protein